MLWLDEACRVDRAISLVPETYLKFFNPRPPLERFGAIVGKEGGLND
jgi:hypothetical protein